ncbi:MAG TPA: aminotransferase class I/II-fold pyridoxal phosphate-dependent enzyme [Oculatellaceae cyanobacterium]|jgi:arginine decarboxylase
MRNVPNSDWRLFRPHPLVKHSPPPLIRALLEYDQHQRRRFHVPAHAGFNLLPPEWDLSLEPYRYDLTELEGLDVLSEPSECLADAQREVAALFGAARSFFLVNGASVGLMAAMLALLKPGDQVLLPRNVHRSVLNGLILTGAEPVWMLPDYLPDWGLWGAVRPEVVEEQFRKHPNIKALFITAPTYEGIGSDVQALSTVCHRHGIYFVVDEAHGSLWPFTEALPPSACRMDCDAVIHSLHKTGGSLTQSALAHLPEGSRIIPEDFQQALNVLQTTSPSYLLLASLEATCHMLASEQGQRQIEQLLSRVDQLRTDLQTHFRHYRLFEPSKQEVSFWDPCKLYLVNPGVSGEDWGPRIEADERIAYESASPHGVLYLAGLGLQPEDYRFFKDVMLREDQQTAENAASSGFTLKQESSSETASASLPEMVMLPREAFFAPGEFIPPAQAVGRIAKETIVHCPPGIPILMPGERIATSHLPLLTQDRLLVVG